MADFVDKPADPELLKLLPDELEIEDKRNTKDSRMKPVCYVCHKLFYAKSTLNKHIKLEHEKQGRYDCDQCEKSYSAKISLRYHIMTKHLDGAKINCDKCNKQFSDVKTYICHRATHKSI